MKYDQRNVDNVAAEGPQIAHRVAQSSNRILDKDSHHKSRRDSQELIATQHQQAQMPGTIISDLAVAARANL